MLSLVVLTVEKMESRELVVKLFVFWVWLVMPENGFGIRLWFERRWLVKCGFPVALLSLSRHQICSTW